MKLAISDLAWQPQVSSEVLSRLKAHEVEALVIAPDVVFERGPAASPKDISLARAAVRDAGLYIAGLQPLTSGLEGASLFGSQAERRVLTEHLKRQAELAGKLAAGNSPISLVFDAPGLRQQNTGRDHDHAVSIFREAASAAHDNNARLVIKPLSGGENTYVTTTAQGVNLVWEVDRPGFGLHLGADAMYGAGEDPYETFQQAMHGCGVSSFDASTPDARPLSEFPDIPHESAACAMYDTQYEGIVSLRMRPPEANSWRESADLLFNEIDYARSLYAYANSLY